MSDERRVLQQAHPLRRIGGIAIVFLLSACTGSSDPPVATDAGGDDQTTAVQAPGTDTSEAPETSVEVSLDPGLYQLDPETGDAELILATAAEPHEPERSPDGSKLVYQRTMPDGAPQIFVLADGSARRLTDFPRGAREPAWSPDGSQIAFAARPGAWEPGSDTDIFVMDADGTHVRRLTGTPEHDRRPDWSPDGSQIVFDTYDAIWVASVPDGQLTRLGVKAVTHWHGPAADATWSPEGRWIVFTRFDPSSINNHLPYAVPWIVRSDGTEEHPLYPSRSPHGVCRLDPTWSPDGRSIAFISGSGGARIGIIHLQDGAIDYLSMSLDVADLSWGTEGLVVSTGDYALPIADEWKHVTTCP